MNRIITVVSLFMVALVAATHLTRAAYGHSTNRYAGLLLPKISDYNIFTGDPVALTPGNGFQLYELATGLFTDYAEKQRLIKVPAGTAITAMHDGLPQFPDGTMLVKTFYYFNDKRNAAAGKRLIETRLLIKNNGQWMAGTYVWNKEQTDAGLTTGGLKTAVSWIDEQANNRTIAYQVPATKDCASCHNASNSLMPIGIKIRNLNREVVRNNTTINQLQYLQNVGIMNAVTIDRFTHLPGWQNENIPIQERVRAYLDVNCAHCHSDAGSCARSTLRFAWEIPLAGTRIEARKKQVINMMEKGRMPRIGTTIVDEEALALIKKYLQSK
ncbi:hypothetical protein A3860_36685 [Niastella vici]|uniref:Uncharacterized protein n=1 Tax=Niastella vici TaxID=1703345 RepID=A0A1V9FMN9_9BACT|nr:c-type cytochrome [Niastella vici]OQP59619.1 hypothetical protein A3860_36685 [Niastella vici]